MIRDEQVHDECQGCKKAKKTCKNAEILVPRYIDAENYAEAVKLY